MSHADRLTAYNGTTQAGGDSLKQNLNVFYDVGVAEALDRHGMQY